MSFVARNDSTTNNRPRAKSLSNYKPTPVFVENNHEGDVEASIFLAVSRTCGHCEIEFAG